MYAHENLFTEDPEHGAALGLLALMTGISEGYWCAGWMGGLEHSCWEARENPEVEHPYGMGIITQRQARMLRDLSDEAGGWWHWPEHRDNARFVWMDEWKALLAVLEAA